MFLLKKISTFTLEKKTIFGAGGYHVAGKTPSDSSNPFKLLKDMQALHTDKAPAAVGPYSQAIEANGFIFASGSLPIDPATNAFVEGGVKEQTRQSLTNVCNVLASAGVDLSHVVKTTVFLSDMENFAAMNEVYAEFFKEPYPARSAFAVKALPKGALVEIECIAVK